MKPLDTLTKSAAFAWLREMLEKMPHAEAYVVGGTVRDAALGRRVKDVDLVVRNVGAEDLKRFLGRHGRVDLVGKRFGVFKFRPKGDGLELPIDIALPRTERAGGSGAYHDFDVMSDPHLPIEKDLERRDFTANAMAWDLRRNLLVDPHGGLADLEERRIRAVGDPKERFREDATRLFRALRFAAELGMTIEEETWKALREGLASYDDAVVPNEAVAREFLKSLDADPLRALELWDDSGAIRRVMPELVQWDHAALERLRSEEARRLFGPAAPTAVLLAVLLYPLGAGAAGELLRRLRFSAVPGFDADPDRVAWLVQHYDIPFKEAPADWRPSRLQSFLYGEKGRKEQLLMTAWAVTETPMLEAWRLVPKIEPPLSGDDVMRLTGFGPGPVIRRILDHLLDEKARGKLLTSEEAEAYLKRKAHEPGFPDPLR